MKTVIPAPRDDHFPLRAAWGSPPCVSVEVLTTTTKRYHGRTSCFAPPSCVCHLHCWDVCTHAGSRPSRISTSLATKMYMCDQVSPFACDMIFMIFQWRRFQTLHRGLMSLHDTCMLRFFWHLVGCPTLRFSHLKAGQFRCPSLARHCRLHWNFQLYPRVCDFFKFTTFGIDETSASQPWSIIEL